MKSIFLIVLLLTCTQLSIGQQIPTLPANFAPDSPNDLSTAFYVAFANTLANGNYRRALEKIWSTADKSALLGISFSVDLWPPMFGSASISQLQYPALRAGTSLTSTISNGTFLAGSVCVDFGVQYQNLDGLVPPKGYQAEYFYATVQELGVAYNRSINLQYRCGGSSPNVFSYVLNGTLPMTDIIFGSSGMVFSKRRNSIAQPGMLTNVLQDYFQSLVTHNITSFFDLSSRIKSQTLLGAAGTGSRQVLQALFPQVPPQNIKDYGDTETLNSALLNGTILAAYQSLVSGDSVTSFSAGTLSGSTSYSRRSNPLDPTNPSGNEALALAVEASLANAAFTGARKVALSDTPSAGVLLDCIPNPATFPFPSPVGLLEKVITNHSVVVGELNVNLPPWFIPSKDPTIAPEGSHANLVQALFNTMAVFYALADPITVEWKYYDTVDALYAALSRGEIDMTGGLVGQGNWFNATFDFLALRKTCSTFTIPYMLYANTMPFTMIEQFYDMLMNTTSQVSLGVVDAVAEQTALMAMLFSSKLNIRQYGTVQALVAAVQSGEVQYAFALDSTTGSQSPLQSISTSIVHPIVPMFRFDAPILPPTPVLQYVRWSSAAAIIFFIIAIVGALAVLAVFGIFLVYNDSPVVRFSHLGFCLTTLVGLLLGYAAFTTYIGRLTAAQCALRPWFSGLAFFFVFGPLLSKLYRLARILNNTALVATVIPTVELMAYAGGIIGIETILLIVWTAVGRLKPKERPGNKELHNIIVCTDDSLWIFLGVQIGYMALAIIASLVLSFRVRTIATRIMWREPLWISYTLYNVCFWLLLYILASAFLWDNYIGSFITTSIALLGLVTSTFGLLFGPKLWILFGTKGGKSSSAGNSATGTGSDFSTNFKPEDDGF